MVVEYKLLKNGEKVLCASIVEAKQYFKARGHHGRLKLQQGDKTHLVCIRKQIKYRIGE